MVRSLTDHNAFVLAQEDYLDPDRYLGDNTPEEYMHPTIQEMLDATTGNRNLYEFYRAVYKASPCGPTIGFRINGQWFYNGDLPTHVEQHEEVDGISVSSIVEGSDVEIDEVQLTGNFTKEDFWTTVEGVSREAEFYWTRDNALWFHVEDKQGKVLWHCQYIDNEEFYTDMPSNQSTIKDIAEALLDSNSNRVDIESNLVAVRDETPDILF